MDTKERENERRDRHDHLPNEEAQNLLANGKKRHNNNTRKINKMWLWLGVLILVFILIWWLWTIGTAEDVTGVDNGVSQLISHAATVLRV